MSYKQLLKLGLQHILHSKASDLDVAKKKQKKFVKFNMQLNKKIETIESGEEIKKTESLINDL